MKLRLFEYFSVTVEDKEIKHIINKMLLHSQKNLKSPLNLESTMPIEKLLLNNFAVRKRDTLPLMYPSYNQTSCMFYYYTLIKLYE
ncbi:hypothetical protein [Alkalihalophilus lindianensis]